MKLRCNAYRPIVMLYALAMLSGCAISPEGIRIPLPSPDVANTKSLHDRMRDASRENAAKLAANPFMDIPDQPGVLVIGELGPLRRQDAKQRAAHYQELIKLTAKEGFGAPTTSEEAYVQRMGGYASVIISGGTILPQRFQLASVPAELIDTLNPPSSFATLLYGGTGDLVVARTHLDGWLQIVQVLCSDKAEDYRACARQYERGRYDSATGFEMTYDNEILKNGDRIDTRTYKPL